MNPPARRRRVSTVGSLSLAGVLTATVLTVASAGTAGAATALGTFTPTAGTWTVTGHGNGHGHGLSQYGSYGRALAGQSATTILGFYYPNTTYAAPNPAVANRLVRVSLSDLPIYPTVAPSAGLSVTTAGALGSAGVQAYRLVPNGKTGMALQTEKAGKWATTRTGLPATSAFSSSAGWVSVVDSDGSVNAYRGSLSGTRNGLSVSTLNIVALDDYVRGVVTNESPSSWPAAALQSQAVAARTYALFEVNEHTASDPYDLCDTSSCQVYRGMSSETATGNAAVAATAGRIITYNGAAAFTQFSSSNGGWTFDGGQPYLVARADPYDKAPTDPWANWTRTATTAQVASYYGLSSVTSITITGRNGNGDFGGAVTTATVNGTRAGKPATVPATGNGLASAMGLPLSWFSLSGGATSTTVGSGGGSTDGTASAGSAAVPSVPTGVIGHPAVGSLTLTWQAPAGTAVVNGYVVKVGNIVRVAAPTARSITVSGLTDGRLYPVGIAARSVAGTSPAVTMQFVPGGVAAGTPAAPAAVTVWTGNQQVVVRWSAITPQPPRYDVKIRGGGEHVVPGASNSAMFSNLANGTSVTLTIRGMNAQGYGASLIVPATPRATPSVPQSLTLKAGVRSVTAKWTAPAATSPGPVRGYLVTVLGTTQRLVPPTWRSAVISGLVSGRRYTVAVLAGTDVGQGTVAIKSFVAR